MYHQIYLLQSSVLYNRINETIRIYYEIQEKKDTFIGPSFICVYIVVTILYYV